MRNTKDERRPFVLTSRAGMMEVGRAPKIVGILNVTPDSFYDGGRYFSPEDSGGSPSPAVERGIEMLNQGAAWVDVGGMSTRPGAGEIPAEEEIRRTAPVIGELVRRRPDAWISVDTYRVSVAEAAIKAGASCINDVSGFSLDRGMMSFAASAKCPVVVNHMKGSPKTMQADPVYENVWEELLEFFEQRLETFVKAGGAESSVIFDPGIGFGKTLDHNLEILGGLKRLHALGRPVLIGCSRKSFIAGISYLNPQSAIRNPQSPDDRLAGSLAAAGWAALQGVHLLRVHDVMETLQFLNVLTAITQRG